MIRRRKTRSAKRTGTAAVEAAMVLPVTLLFLLGIMEYGRYVMTMQLMTNAARAGARYALTHVQPIILGGTTYGSATTDVQNVVNQALGGISLSGQSVQVFESSTTGTNTGSWNSAQAGQSVCVQITGNYVPIVARFLYMPTTLPVSVQSVARAESS